jgi:hypothetical protein
MFSTTQITRLEPLVHKLSQKLCDRLLSTTGVFDIARAYSCFTVDVITDYSFDNKKGFLDQDSWHPNFRDASNEVAGMANIARQLPWLNAIMDMIPVCVVNRVVRNRLILLM